MSLKSWRDFQVTKITILFLAMLGGGRVWLQIGASFLKVGAKVVKCCKHRQRICNRVEVINPDSQCFHLAESNHLGAVGVGSKVFKNIIPHFWGLAMAHLAGCRSPSAKVTKGGVVCGRGSHILIFLHHFIKCLSALNLTMFQVHANRGCGFSCLPITP